MFRKIRFNRKISRKDLPMGTLNKKLRLSTPESNPKVINTKSRVNKNEYIQDDRWLTDCVDPNCHATMISCVSIYYNILPKLFEVFIGFGQIHEIMFKEFNESFEDYLEAIEKFTYLQINPRKMLSYTDNYHNDVALIDDCSYLSSEIYSKDSCHCSDCIN